MVKLSFENLELSATLTCVANDGVVADEDSIKKEIENGLEMVLTDILDSRNNIVAFEVHEVVNCSDGVDKLD